MEFDQISQLAIHLRRTIQSNPNVLSLSTSLLSTLLSAFDNVEEISSLSFHIRPGSNLKKEMLRDVHFLYMFIQNAKTVKLYLDSYPEVPLDISKFKNVVTLELMKIDVNYIKGIQKLRPQLQKLVCHRTQNNLNDILSNCGGDNSQSYSWNELKEAVFSNNGIAELNASLECAPWLHTLDLSHNQIDDITILNSLVNLKHLNLSYNKLEAIPPFKGQICSRLQNLILKNNFIEDTSGLQTLLNIWVLDLSNNCLVDHKCLLSISHLATLQWLNLDSNPLSFHPHHRTKTASYLHTNAASTHFVLDHAVLTKAEKRVIGTLYPMQSKSFTSLANDSISVTSEKVRRIRHVTIEEESVTKQDTSPIITPTCQQHLQTKKQIESLRAQYGDSWLNQDSGVLVQNVLGFENASLPVSSSPYEVDFLLHSSDFRQGQGNVTNHTEASFVTALDTTAEVTLPDQFNDAEDTVQVDSESEVSEGDLDLDGEESIYLATPKGEVDQIFLVITQTHLSEKESSTSKERQKWHIHSINNCQVLDESDGTVQIDFETMRKDRKQRIYVIEEEVEQFVACIRDKMVARLPEKKHIEYQCMKCSAHFARLKKECILGESVLTCPTCDSTLVVESS